MRTHSDYSRVQAAWGGESSRQAIRTLLLQLADAPDGTLPGPEELIEAVERTPGANRAHVAAYFAFRPPDAPG